MRTHTEQVDLPYSQHEVFSLVADIESYPHFLPSVISARISRRDGATLWVDQLVRFTVLPMPLATRADLHAPHSIRIECQGNRIVRFTELWSFLPQPGGGTRLRSHTEYEFTSRLMGRALEARFADLQRQTMLAFAARARELYGAKP